MTEDGARLSWCPFGRQVNNPGSLGKDYPAINRGQTGHGETMCLGARCMAWRWKDAAEQEGYCGLAGRPRGYEV